MNAGSGEVVAAIHISKGMCARSLEATLTILTTCFDQLLETLGWVGSVGHAAAFEAWFLVVRHRFYQSAQE